MIGTVAYCFETKEAYENNYHGSTLVLARCKEDHWSQCKKVHFVQPQSAIFQPIANKFRRRYYMNEINNCTQFGEYDNIRTNATRGVNNDTLVVSL
jgi:hypothetical protein